MMSNGSNHYFSPMNTNNQFVEAHWDSDLWPETHQTAVGFTEDMFSWTEDFESFNRATTIDHILSNGDRICRPDAQILHSPTLPNNDNIASTFNPTFTGSDLTTLWRSSESTAMTVPPYPTQGPCMTMSNGFQGDYELARVPVQKHNKPKNKSRKQSVGKGCFKRTSPDALGKAMKYFECWMDQNAGEKPKRKHIQAFQALSNMSQDAIEEWFNYRVSEPVAIALSNSDAETKSLAAECCTGVQDHCTKNLNPETMARNRAASFDPARPFCCTSLCGATFPTKDDWNKHERLNRPQIGYFCNLDVRWQDGNIMRCTRCNAEDPTNEHTQDCMGSRRPCAMKQIKRGPSGRVFIRKDKLKQHFSNLHRSVPFEQFVGLWEFRIEDNFEKRCGFCSLPLENWRHRIEHVGGHFKGEIQNGPWTLDRWKNPWREDEDILIVQSGDIERAPGKTSFDSAFSD